MVTSTRRVSSCRQLIRTTPRFVVADLGSAFEAGPNYHYGVLEYNAPERLMDLEVVEPRADIFSLGIVFAAIIGFKFPFQNAKRKAVQLQVLCQQLGRPRPTDFPAMWHSHLNGLQETASRPLSPIVSKKYGTAAHQFMSQALQWMPTRRPTGLEASCHLFSRGGRLLGLGPLCTSTTYGGRQT
jgi:serine/threonine protein kinase